MDCPFCIIDPEINSLIYTSEHALVVLSNPRLMLGHLLVIPKNHVEKISELSNEEQKDLFDTTVDFQEKILSSISSGCDIRQNYRPFQKQGNIKVNHLHIHLLPRNSFDELYKECQKFETDIFQRPSQEEMSNIKKLLLD